MNLPDTYFDLIIKEMDEAKELIEEANTMDDKLYFFSSSFGIINRVMNFHSDPILIFIHQALANAHANISKRMNSPHKPDVVSTSVPDVMFDALFSNFDLLIAAIKSKDEDEIRKVLEKYAVLTYATSGNGFYLLLKGKITL
jgi:DNA-binding GntR family transcriptional regulator